MKEKLRAGLATHFDESVLKTYYDPLIIKSRDEWVSITPPHRYFAAFMPKDLIELLQQELRTLQEGHCRLEFHIPKTFSPNLSKGKSGTHHPYGTQNTFEKFLVNKKNYFPFISAQKIALGEEQGFNPFLINGCTGTGKTHLAMAMANCLAHRLREHDVLVTTGDELAGIFRQDLSADSFLFQRHLDRHAALIVDNLHELAEDTGLQDELVRTFDRFEAQGKLMVFCLSVLINKQKNMKKELTARLESGLMVTLKGPDLDIRTRYVDQFLQQFRIRLSRQQVLTLAMQYETFRSLRGILLKIRAFTQLVRSELNEQDFQSILDSMSDSPAPNVTPKLILETVSHEMRIKTEDLVSAKRKQEIVLARQIAMYLCRLHLGLSYAELGKIFGGRDHSTVIHSLKKINEIQEDDPKMKQRVRWLSKECLSSSQVREAPWRTVSSVL